MLYYITTILPPPPLQARIIRELREATIAPGRAYSPYSPPPEPTLTSPPLAISARLTGSTNPRDSTNLGGSTRAAASPPRHEIWAAAAARSVEEVNVRRKIETLDSAVRTLTLGGARCSVEEVHPHPT